ncbi:MAG: hypothetical protein ACTHQQ_04030 [Solirubrobacteraceae bacterium]
MHNLRREQFFESQRREQARNLIIDHYIAQRSGKGQARPSEEHLAAPNYSPAIGQTPRLRGKRQRRPTRLAWLPV